MTSIAICFMALSISPFLTIAVINSLTPVQGILIVVEQL